MSCINCNNKRAISDKQRYGFELEVGATYMTIVEDIKSCCPIKVVVTSFDGGTVSFSVNEKSYTWGKKQFMSSSWRAWESF